MKRKGKILVAARTEGCRGWQTKKNAFQGCPQSVHMLLDMQGIWGVINEEELILDCTSRCNVMDKDLYKKVLAYCCDWLCYEPWRRKNSTMNQGTQVVSRGWKGQTRVDSSPRASRPADYFNFRSQNVMIITSYCFTLLHLQWCASASMGSR